MGSHTMIKSGKTPLNPCLKSQRVWLDKELVKTAI